MKNFNLSALLCAITFVSCQKEASLSNEKNPGTIDSLVGYWKMDSMESILYDQNGSIVATFAHSVDNFSHAEFKADSSYEIHESLGGMSYGGRILSVDVDKREISANLMWDMFVNNQPGSGVHINNPPLTLSVLVLELTANEAILAYQGSGPYPYINRRFHYHLKR